MFVDFFPSPFCKLWVNLLSVSRYRHLILLKVGVSVKEKKGKIVFGWQTLNLGLGL